VTQTAIWEVYVYEGPAAPAGDGYGQLLAILPGWSQVSIAPLGNNVGAGSVSVPLDSPVFHQLGPGGRPYNSETSPVLARESLWQCRRNGNQVFEFLAQSVDRTTVSPDETRTVTVSGPGCAQVLNWGMAMPFGWRPVDGGFIGSTGAIQDPFDEQDTAGDYIIDTGLWNLSTPGACAVVPGTSYTYNETYENYGTYTDLSSQNQTYFNGGGGSVNVTLEPGGAYLGGGPFVFAGSSFSANVTPPVLNNLGAPGTPIDNDATNGSDVTQLIVRPASGTGYAMIALGYPQFFCEFQDGNGAITHYTIGTGLVGGTGGYDSSFGGYWRISCDRTALGGQYLYRFWTSGDGAAWTLQFAHTPGPTAGWDATQANVYLGGTYNTTGKYGAYANFQSINGEITAGADLGPVYINQPAMAMVWDQLNRFAARGTIPFVQKTWSLTQDSSGEQWTDSWSVQIPVGTDGLSMMQNYAGAIDVNWYMAPGYVLSASINPGRQLQEAIVFHEGEISSYGRTQTRDTIYNVAATADGAGMIWTEASEPSIQQWGQRETWVASGGAVNSSSAVNCVAAAVDQWANEVDARVLQVPPNADGKTLFTDIQMWDWIGIERSDFAEVDSLQVIGLSVSIDQDGAETHELIVNTYRQVLAQWFLYLMNKFGGQAASTLGSLTPGSTAGTAFTLATGPSMLLTPQQLGGGSSLAATLQSATALAATPEVAAAQVPSAPGFGSGGGGIIPGQLIQDASIPASAVGFSFLDIGGTNVGVYYQPTMPVGDGIGANSVWYNTGQGNQMSIYTDGVWTPALFGQGSVTAGIIDGTVISGNTINGAQVNSAAINTSTLSASSIGASTITGTTINGGTINGTLINGATFTGTDWIELPAGEFFYSSSFFTGNLSISIAPVGGVDSWNNPYGTGVTVYGGTAYAQLYTNLSGDPVLQMTTGVVSEASAAAVYTAPLSVGTATEQMRSTMQGPASTADSNRVSVNLYSATKNGTTAPANGTLSFQATALLAWGTTGVTIAAPGLTVNSGASVGSLHVAAGIGTTSSSGDLVVDGTTSLSTSLSVGSGGAFTVSSGGTVNANGAINAGAQISGTQVLVINNSNVTVASINGLGALNAVTISNPFTSDANGNLSAVGTIASGAITSTGQVQCTQLIVKTGGTTQGSINGSGALNVNTISGPITVTATGNLSCGTITSAGITSSGTVTCTQLIVNNGGVQGYINGNGVLNVNSINSPITVNSDGTVSCGMITANLTGTASHATAADSATNAGHATTATTATSANACTGNSATATTATNASHASTADSATNAGHATTATTATTANNLSGNYGGTVTGTFDGGAVTCSALTVGGHAIKPQAKPVSVTLANLINALGNAGILT
jgi:hypothetical protein